MWYIEITTGIKCGIQKIKLDSGSGAGMTLARHSRLAPESSVFQARHTGPCVQYTRFARGAGSAGIKNLKLD